jgi:Uma2 family endonuclease
LTGQASRPCPAQARISSQPKTLLSAEEYLEIERKAESKSEFYAGEMFAMAGASANHNILVWNLIAKLSRQLESRRCRGFPSDLRVRTPTGLHTYPDVVVVCGEPEFLDNTLLNPKLLVEVLSPSAEGYDRGRKFEHYRPLASLQEYLLVASDRRHLDLYRRQEGGQWLLSSAGKGEEAIELRSVECRLQVGELYERVEFEASGSLAER